MVCMGCNAVEVAPVALRDGRTVCNTCPDWKHECLLRDLAGYESNEKRRGFMEKYEARHGKAMAAQLRAEVWKVMKGWS